MRSIEYICSEIPEIASKLDKQAGTLSGGERQMVMLGMVLIRQPCCLLLDEPSLGLAPGLGQRLLARIASLSREMGLGALVVEQRVRDVLEVADRVLVLRNGKVTYRGLSTDLAADEELLRNVYL